jgi:hypothetical protein
MVESENRAVLRSNDWDGGRSGHSSASGPKSPKKKSSKMKKKIPKISEDCESVGVKSSHTCSSNSDDASKGDKSVFSIKVKAPVKQKTPKVVKKKLPSKVLDEGKSSVHTIKRTKSLENDKSPNGDIHRTQSLDVHDNKKSLSLTINQDRDRGMHYSDGGDRGGRGGRGRGSSLHGRGRGRGRGSGPTSGSKGSSHPLKQPERTREARSRSVERKLSGGDRMKDGRSRSVERKPLGGDNMRGRSRSTEGRIPGRGNSREGRSRSVERASPSKMEAPKSILRKSSHHQSTHHRSHHHRLSMSTATTVGTSVHSNNARRFGMGAKRVGVGKERLNSHSSFTSDVESMCDDEDDDDDNDSFAMEDQETVRRQPQRPMIKTLSRTMKQSIRSLVSMDISNHTQGLGTSSHHTHRTNALARTKSQAAMVSARSLMMVEKSEFEGENRFIGFLRYVRLMAPVPDEEPVKKKIRIVTWLALFFDFLNALVATITYGGETTQCCGKSIMNALSDNVNWDKLILVVTSLYMLLIFLEVLPVMKDAFPFNLFNPVIGFLITFAVFFSDSITEAATCWSFEALAVLCEIFGYRLRLQMFADRKARLKQCRKDIKKLRKIKRKVKDRFDNGHALTRTGSENNVLDVDLSDSESFAADDTSLDAETQHKSTAGRAAHTTVSDIGNFRETRLLRDRRQLIHSQAELERDLRYHLIGVSINAFLVIFSLLMIVIIASNGGMCIVGMNFGNIFSKDQEQKCANAFTAECPVGELCEICPMDGSNELIVADIQCYYPYGIGFK